MVTRIIEGASRVSGRPSSNPKHEHFAQLIARGETPAEAYARSGYSQRGASQSGNRLRRNPNVAARIEELTTSGGERHAEQITIDSAWVTARLIQNAERAMEVEAIRDRASNPTGQYTYQGAAANKALELLGKQLGMFQLENVEAGRSDDEVAESIQRGMERAARASSPWQK